MSTRRWFWSVLLALYAGAIFVLSGLPLAGEGRLFTFPLLDKLIHGAEYALFFLLCRNAVGRRTALAFAITALYAGSDELHQAFVPTRHASIGDFAADLIGACSIVLAHRVSLLVAKPRRILRKTTSEKEE